MEGEKKYLATIGEFPKINSEIWQKITAYFPDYKSAYKASLSEFISAGIPEQVAADLHSYLRRSDPGRVWERYQKLGIEVTAFADKEYPKLLKEIFNPPFIIYIKGSLLPEDDFAIGVVGSRKATDYGRRATSEITSGLSRAGFTIVSGLALGLDAEAHKAALSCEGRTLAVLANGLDQVYPSSNTALANQILKNGALISEQPIGVPPLKHNFPARNRIISGLSQGILICEAGEHSGTLHTANFALEQNRQVYAIPGPIYNPLSVGPNNLLKAGAKAVTTPVDILEDFGLQAPNLSILQPDDKNETLIFGILESEPKHIDTITAESEKPAHEISQILTLMEIKGKVRHLGGMVYTLKT